MSVHGSLGTTLSRCPCGSGAPYAACCAPLHHGESQAQTAEALMRSRYSAYALGEVDYVVRTWHPRHRPGMLDLDPATTWTGLVIGVTSGGGPDDDRGTVEFRAAFVVDGQVGELREISRYERRAGRWFYVAGVTH